MTYKTLTLGTVALSLCFVVAVQAQPKSAPQPPGIWSMFIGQQLSQSLESPTAEIRQIALEQVLQLKHTYAAELDLTPVVPHLVAIFTNDPDPQCRLAAVVAIHTLGDEEGMQHVWAKVHRQTDKRVQYAAVAALIDHYGADAFRTDPTLTAIAAELREYFHNVDPPTPAIARKN